MTILRRTLVACVLVAGGCEPVDSSSGGSPASSTPVPASAAAVAEPEEELPPDAPRIDVAFCLDATGSMGGVIDRAKSKVEEIAAWLRRGEPKPRVRFGLVVYRDKGDSEPLRNYGFLPSARAMRDALASVSATGGGDLPEHVVAGLRSAVNDLPWDDKAALKTLFLIGDAEPHLDYGADSDDTAVLETAVAKGIRIGAIACGEMSAPGHRYWEKVAHATGGPYQALPGTSGAALKAEMELEEAVFETLRREAGAVGVKYAGGTDVVPTPRAPDGTAAPH